VGGGGGGGAGVGEGDGWGRQGGRILSLLDYLEGRKERGRSTPILVRGERKGQGSSSAEGRKESVAYFSTITPKRNRGKGGSCFILLALVTNPGERLSLYETGKGGKSGREKKDSAAIGPICHLQGDKGKEGCPLPACLTWSGEGKRKKEVARGRVGCATRSSGTRERYEDRNSRASKRAY